MYFLGQLIQIMDLEVKLELIYVSENNIDLSIDTFPLNIPKGTSS